MDVIQQWQSGSSQAFEVLFHRYKNMVFKTALLMVGDGHQAEDMLQEVFVKVYKSKNKFKGDENGFKQWLYRITINICLDSHRRKSPPLSSLEQIREGGFDLAVSTSRDWEEVDAVRRAIKSLDRKHSLVVILRYSLELSYEEIAQVLDIPIGTVRSRLNAAIKTLRKVLVGEGGKEVTA